MHIALLCTAFICVFLFTRFVSLSMPVSVYMTVCLCVCVCVYSWHDSSVERSRWRERRSIENFWTSLSGPSWSPKFLVFTRIVLLYKTHKQTHTPTHRHSHTLTHSEQTIAAWLCKVILLCLCWGGAHNEAREKEMEQGRGSRSKLK